MSITQRIGKDKSLNRLQREAIRLIVAVLIFSAALWLYGCSHQPMTVPSSGAVRGGLSTAQSQQSTVSQAAHHVQTTNDRIDAKDAFLKGYYKWKAAHPSPTPKL